MKSSAVPALLFSLVSALLIAAAPGFAFADDAEPKERAEPRGRLPNYYSSVVTEVQRETIYGIQAKYAKQIDDLKQQLRKLVEQRDAEVADVLSPEQKAKLVEVRAEALARRRAAAEARKQAFEAFLKQQGENEESTEATESAGQE